MRKSIAFIALAAATLAAPVAANQQADSVRVTVHHRDLDLSHAHAQRRLERRVRAAINDVCVMPRLDLRAAQRAFECRTLARAEAETQRATAVARAAGKTFVAAATAGKPGA